MNSDLEDRLAQRQTLLLGVIVGMVAFGLVLYLDGLLTGEFFNFWGMLGFFGVIATGAWIDQRSEFQSRLGVGIAVGAPLGIIGLLVFLADLGSAIGS